MLRKYASLEVLESWRAPAQAGKGMQKSAHRVAFDYEPRPGYLYVRSRMISSRTNDNHDTFPADEIEKGYRTFLGKPVFVNHHNANHRRARGVIVAVALHRDRNPDSSPDTWVEGLMEVDALRFPRLAKAIISGRVNRTSMGVDVEWSHCSACGNKATSPAEYCKHLPALKGKKIRKRNPATGKVEEKIIHEICAGLSFFENSLLVEEPADPTAYVVGSVDARGLSKAASASRPLQEFDQLRPHEQEAVAQYHQQMTEEGNAPAGSSPRSYLYEPRQEPRADFLDRYMDADDEFKREYPNGPADWDAHHRETLATHPIPGYPAEGRWPLIVSDDNKNYVDDGYHRLHSYMRDGATHIPTIRMHRQGARRTASAPDFRDHISNPCTQCGKPVHFARGLEMRGRYPWQHRHQSLVDHEAVPSDESDRRSSQNPTFSGGHCLLCGGPVKINLNALDLPSGGWHHGDGMKRDHDAMPADEQAAYDSIPGQKAAFEQARGQVRDTMHRQFEHLEGRPLPPRPRGDEDQMPPDPFLASRRQATGLPGISDKATHCINCGQPMGYGRGIGNYPHGKMPFLCNDCAIGGSLGEESFGKKPPLDIHDKGGMGSQQNSERWVKKVNDHDMDRPWTPEDNRMSSQSARTAAIHPEEWCPECGAQGSHLEQLSRAEGRYLPSALTGDAVHCRRCDSTFDSGDHANSRPGSPEPSQFSRSSTHCMSCGVPLHDQHDPSQAGDWRHAGYPHLCMHCAIGPVEEDLPGTPGKPHPIFPGNKGGYHLRPSLYSEPGVFDQVPEGYRDWGPGDNMRQSTSSRTAAAPRKGGDHPFFKANPVSSANIVKAYHETTEDEKSLGDRWYSDAHHVAKAISGGDAAKGAGVLSAYSVRTNWPVNMFNASRAFQGDPPGPGSGAMTVHQKPAMAIIAGKHWSQALKGPKTRAFAHLIEHGGDTPEDEEKGTHKVVIDRHAMSVAMGHRVSDKDEAPLGQPQHYEHVAQLYRDAARDISKASGRKVSPHQVQAATWLGQIRKNQAADKAGEGGGGSGASKGRVKRDENAKAKWRHHHPHAHPGGIPEENMHHHGAAGERRCFGCQGPLNVRGRHFTTEHPHVPGLCMGCSLQTVQGPDVQANPDLMGEGRRPFLPEDHLPPSLSSCQLLPAAASLAARTAYGETRVPSQVDTLRMEECPVCGESDVWSGDRCPVCGFIVPPSLFRDPDVTKAQQVREQLDQDGEVVTQGTPGDPSAGEMGSGEDADDQMTHPDQAAPDGTPGVQGEGSPVPAADTDGQPPGDEEAPGDGTSEELQGEEEVAQGADEEAEGQELEQDAAEGGQALPPDLVCPACGAAFSTDMAAQPGTPCPACRMGALEPVGGPQKDQEDPDSDEADDEDEDEGEDMPAGSKTAAALARAQAHRIAVLSAENEVLAAQLGFLASAAGVDRHLAQIRQNVLRRHADLLNPASPVPDPPEAPAPESTEQALQPLAQDDPSRPGSTPGANAGVPAQMTTTSITPGVEMQTPPATNLVDVTAPVQGTNPSQDGGVPMEQRRIETDVRVDPDPLKAHGPGIGGQGDNGAAFPWMLDAQPQQQQGQRQGSVAQGVTAAAANGGSYLDAPSEAVAANRTFASIRLAKLRIATGSAEGDELMVAERIERDASLPTALIEHEVSVLSRMPASQPQAPRPMQRAAARSAPSLASVGASSYYAPAAMDDLDGSDIFL